MSEVPQLVSSRAEMQSQAAGSASRSDHCPTLPPRDPGPSLGVCLQNARAIVCISRVDARGPLARRVSRGRVHSGQPAANEPGNGLQEFHSGRQPRGEGGGAVQAQEGRLDSVLSTGGEERR